MAETYQGVGFKKGSAYDIIASYCFFTPVIDAKAQEAIKKVDETFSNAITSTRWESGAALYRDYQRKFAGNNVAQAALFTAVKYHRALSDNGRQARDLGRAQTWLAFLDSKETLPNVSQLEAEATRLCAEGDQFYCGAKEALTGIAAGRNLPYGYLGRVFAPYFGSTLWNEIVSPSNNCQNISKREQTAAIVSK